MTLNNCPLRNEGLFYLAAMHQKTLKTLEFCRIILDRALYPMSVSKLADLCEKFLPDLTYLLLSKLNVYHPDGFQIHSSKEEEIYSFYRWAKREGGGGDGLARHAWDIERIVERESRPVHEGSHGGFEELPGI